MMKYLSLIGCICFSLSVFGQNARLLKINSEKVTTLKLSDIAEKEVSFALNKPFDAAVGYYYLPNQYLYITSMSTVYQYDFSGKFIRKINGGGFIWTITGDEKKKELYILVGQGEKNVLKCFDYSCKRLREYLVPNNIVACTHYKSKCWMVRFEILNDSILHYHLCNLDYQTGKVKDCGVLYKETIVNGAISNASFSEYKGNLLVAVNADTIMYQVFEDQFKPYMRWSFHHPTPLKSLESHTFKRFITNSYLFLEHGRYNPQIEDHSTAMGHLYVKSLTDPLKEYNVVRYDNSSTEPVEGVFDDLYSQTKRISLETFNLPNHLLYLTKKKDEQTGEEKTWVNIVRVK